MSSQSPDTLEACEILKDLHTWMGEFSQYNKPGLAGIHPCIQTDCWCMVFGCFCVVQAAAATENKIWKFASGLAYWWADNIFLFVPHLTRPKSQELTLDSFSSLWEGNRSAKVSCLLSGDREHRQKTKTRPGLSACTAAWSDKAASTSLLLEHKKKAFLACLLMQAHRTCDVPVNLLSL